MTPSPWQYVNFNYHAVYNNNNNNNNKRWIIQTSSFTQRLTFLQFGAMLFDDYLTVAWSLKSYSNKSITKNHCIHLTLDASNTEVDTSNLTSKHWLII